MGYIIILVVIVLFIWYLGDYSLYDDLAGFHRGRRRYPHIVRYDPSLYYYDSLDWYESPNIFFDKLHKSNINNQAYWQCFEINKSSGASNSDAYKLCRNYIN